MKLVKDNLYTVTVEEVKESIGIIVSMEDGTTNLIHISNISNEFVRDISDYVEIGKMYVALCIEGKKRPLELSLKHLDLKEKRVYAKPKDEDITEDTHIVSVDAVRNHLDSMIEKANKDYKDKMQINKSKRNKRR